MLQFGRNALHRNMILCTIQQSVNKWSHFVQMAKDSDKLTKTIEFKKYDILQNSNRWQMNGLIRQRWLNWIQSPAGHLQYYNLWTKHMKLLFLQYKKHLKKK